MSWTPLGRMPGQQRASKTRTSCPARGDGGGGGGNGGGGCAFTGGVTNERPYWRLRMIFCPPPPLLAIHIRHWRPLTGPAPRGKWTRRGAEGYRSPHLVHATASTFHPALGMFAATAEAGRPAAQAEVSGLRVPCPARTRPPEGVTSVCESGDLPSLAHFRLKIAILTTNRAKHGNCLASHWEAHWKSSDSGRCVRTRQACCPPSPAHLLLCFPFGQVEGALLVVLLGGLRVRLLVGCIRPGGIGTGALGWV